MEALPYVDTLVKEYLLFRGFTASLQAFNVELAADRGCGFQVPILCLGNNLTERSLIEQKE
jgi:hypothetical protein